MVLYSSTNLHILKPWAIIYNLIRFDLAFWQAWKPFDRKLKDREKVLEEFQRLSRFTRKMVLYSSTNFHILKPWGIICNIERFDLGFWQASKPFYRKLKYGEKVFEEFQTLPHFPRKMVLYWSTYFCIWKPRAIVSNLIRLDLDFWQASKPFYMKLKYREENIGFWNSNIGFWNSNIGFWKSFNVCRSFPEKWFCIGQPIFTF